VTSDNPQSAAFVRFGSCRWQQPAEDGNQAFCTHREVKPYAGTTGFDPDAWCPECQYYKLRRAPKKRERRSPVVNHEAREEREGYQGSKQS
jgi:hypothetical protein